MYSSRIAHNKYWQNASFNFSLVLVVPTEEEVKKYGFIKACVNKVINGVINDASIQYRIKAEQLMIIKRI